MQRRAIWFFAALIMLLVAFTYAQAAENKFPTLSDQYSAKTVLKTEETIKTSIGLLPDSLQFIDDSAFEGTALGAVDLPSGVTYIGDRAFANIPTLLSVKIPDDTQYIGKDAFNNSKQVILTASANSYARDWAKKNGLPFQLLVTFNAGNGTTQSTIQPNRNTHPSQKESADTTEKTNTNNRERKTGRSVGELKASQNKGVAALYIQSRYFP